MSDYPFKKGDLVDIRSSFYHDRETPYQGVIVEERDGGFFDVLVDGEIKLIHRNYIVTPRIKSVNVTSGVKNV